MSIWEDKKEHWREDIESLRQDGNVRWPHLFFSSVWSLEPLSTIPLENKGSLLTQNGFKITSRPGSLINTVGIHALPAGTSFCISWRGFPSIQYLSFNLIRSSSIPITREVLVLKAWTTRFFGSFWLFLFWKLRWVSFPFYDTPITKFIIY